MLEKCAELAFSKALRGNQAPASGTSLRRSIGRGNASARDEVIEAQIFGRPEVKNGGSLGVWRDVIRLLPLASSLEVEAEQAI